MNVFGECICLPTSSKNKGGERGLDIVTEQVKKPSGTPAFDIGMPVRVEGALLLIQLPMNAPRMQ